MKATKTITTQQFVEDFVAIVRSGKFNRAYYECLRAAPDPLIKEILVQVDLYNKNKQE